MAKADSALHPRPSAGHHARLQSLTLSLALFSLIMLLPRAGAQAPGTSRQGANPTASSAISGAQTQLSNAAGDNGARTTQDSFHGSIVSEKDLATPKDLSNKDAAGNASATTLQLSLDDAIARGLRQNLGVILQGSAAQSAHGEQLEQLQQLLPTVTAASTLTVEQVNLAAFGLRFPGIRPIVGPFQVVDFRAYLTQNVVNIAALQNYLASKHNFAAAQLSAQDARDLVVLTVGNAYLLCIADQARIDSVNAELKTSRLSFDQATAAHDAGTSPRLDVLRAQVDFQNEQQNLISAGNGLAKDKIALARAIGLPLNQPFALTDTAPFKTLDNLDPELAFTQALAVRKDLQAAGEQLKAAQAQKKAAVADQYPVASISGDYGDIGTTPGHSHGTFTATGQVSAPILQIVRNRGEQQIADAALAQSRARLSDQAQQVNADIRSSILDIQSAARLVDATRSNVELATEALSEAQQRFHVGVSDNLPVSEAQTRLEQANDGYISALYQHNVAKLSLARALGVAQTSYKDYLGGK